MSASHDHVEGDIMLQLPKEKGASVITPTAPSDTTYSDDVTDAKLLAQHLKALYFGLHNQGLLSQQALAAMFARHPEWRAA